MRSPPSVVHLVPSLFGDEGIVGGAERYALELARHMAERVPTTLVCFGSEDREERSGSLRLHVLGGGWHIRGERTNPISLRIIGPLLGADVVHCHQRRVVMSSLAAAVSRITRKRVFATDLGGGGLDISSWVDTAPWYHGHLHISAYSRRISGHDRFADAHVIYGGVDNAKFRPRPAAPADGRVLFVGRILPHKGVDDLIRAMPSDLTLEVIGRAYHQQYLSDLRELASGKRICFRHDCDDDRLIDAYQRATCLVLPSVYRSMYGAESVVPELLGQTLLEGMACGLPVICTDVASMPEVVEDGVTGFVVPPNDPHALGDRLRWIRDNPVEAGRMGAAGRRRVEEHFSWSAVVERCLRIYGISD